MPEPRPLPLFVWLEQQRGRRAAARLRARRIALRCALGGAALAALGATIAWPPVPRVVWNASASAPIGLYRIVPDRVPDRGQFALVQLPRDLRLYAARRGYLPANVPAIKRVAALPGQTICARRGTIQIDLAPPVPRRDFDGHGRALPWWTGCRVLGKDEIFLLNDAPGSFDGRYFGPIRRERVIGEARLLWTR